MIDNHQSAQTLNAFSDIQTAWWPLVLLWVGQLQHLRMLWLASSTRQRAAVVPRLPRRSSVRRVVSHVLFPKKPGRGCLYLHVKKGVDSPKTIKNKRQSIFTNRLPLAKIPATDKKQQQIPTTNPEVLFSQFGRLCRQSLG